MKYAYLVIILILAFVIFILFGKVEQKKDATTKIRLIKNTLRYRVEHKIDTDITLTTQGRSVQTVNNWLKYF